MWTRAELKQIAKERMKANYWKMLLASLVVSLLTGSLFNIVYNINTTTQEILYSEPYSYTVPPQHQNLFMMIVLFLLGTGALFSILGIAYNIFISSVMEVGHSKFYINDRNQKANVKNVFFAFNHNYMNHVKIMFLMNVKIFLWTLVFIVPGIIKAYEYAMIPFILSEQPDISSEEAFRLSKQLTDNEKFNLFILNLSFLGWLFLGALACGIGVIFVTPYVKATETELYFKLKEIKGIQIGTNIPPAPDFIL